MEYIYLQIFMININHPYREIYSPIDPLNIVRASQRTTYPPSGIRVSFSALSRETNAEKTPDKNKAGGFWAGHIRGVG